MDYKKAYDEAKSQGYSDSEIASHLSGDESKYKEAISAGHTDTDIISHFVGSPVAASQETTTPAQPEQSGMDMVMNAAKGAFVRPAKVVADFATNPQAQANALPMVMGTAGSFAGPGGATLGAVTGESLKQIASRALGNTNVPQTAGAAALELAKTAAISGALEKTIGLASKGARLLSAGKRIGEAEKAAGVVTKAADKYPTSGNVGEMLNTLESQVVNGTLKSAQDLRTAKDIIDFIHQNARIVGKTKNITVQSARVGKLISTALNNAVPNRAAASADFATLMKIKDAAKTVGTGAGVLAGGAATIAAIRSFLKGR